MNSTEKTEINKPSLLQSIVAILVAAFMWGSGNVLSRSLLIEGVNAVSYTHLTLPTKRIV